MTIHEAIMHIESSGTVGHAFKITFVKTDGSIREMIAVKRNKQRKPNGESEEKSDFNYNLNAKNSLLLNECTEFRYKTIDEKGIGTIHRLINAPTDPASIISPKKVSPKTIKLHSILAFNDQKVYA